MWERDTAHYAVTANIAIIRNGLPAGRSGSRPDSQIQIVPQHSITALANRTMKTLSPHHPDRSVTISVWSARVGSESRETEIAAVCKMSRSSRGDATVFPPLTSSACGLLSTPSFV